MPALFTQMSMRPSSASAASTRCARSSGSATSQRTATIRASARASSSSRSARRAQATTRAPASASTVANRAPRPLEAPVTIATRPASGVGFATSRMIYSTDFSSTNARKVMPNAWSSGNRADPVRGRRAHRPNLAQPSAQAQLREPAAAPGAGRGAHPRRGGRRRPGDGVPRPRRDVLLGVRPRRAAGRLHRQRAPPTRSRVRSARICDASSASEALGRGARRAHDGRRLRDHDQLRLRDRRGEREDRRLSHAAAGSSVGQARSTACRASSASGRRRS